MICMVRPERVGCGANLSGPPKEAPDRAAEKRTRIAETAVSHLVRYGFRKTSVEAVAAEADVAKATLYAYFPDRDALFRAAIERVCEKLVAAAEEAAREEGPVAHRVAAVLLAKYGALHELLAGSPHAAELLDSQNHLAKEIVAKADRAYQRVLAGVIEEAVEARAIDPRRAGLDARTAAQLLMHAASGMADGGPTAKEHRKRIADLVRAMLVGLGANG